MDQSHNSGGSRAILIPLFLACAASLAVAGRLADTNPDMPMRAALALPFALLALPIATARITPALRRAAIACGATSAGMARHLVLPLCGPFVLPIWLLAAAFIAAPAAPAPLSAPLPATLTWAPFILLAIVTYAGLLRQLTARPAT